MNLDNIVLFLQFGLILNGLSFVLHFMLVMISVVNIDPVELVKFKDKLTSASEEYKEYMLKYHKVRYYLRYWNIFIPFYGTWALVSILMNRRAGVSYHELPFVLMSEEIQRRKMNQKV